MEESPRRGLPNWPGAISMFLQAGACFGFFDVVAARSHGALLPEDSIALFLTPMILFGIVGGVVALLMRLARGRGGEEGSTGVSAAALAACFLPILLQGSRGCLRGCGFTSGQWVMRFLPTLLLSLSVLGFRRRLTRNLGQAFFPLAATIAALSTLTFEQRFDVASTFSSSFIAQFIIWTLLGITAGAWLGSRLRSAAAAVAGLALVTACAAAASSSPIAAPRSRVTSSEGQLRPVTKPPPSNILLIVLDSVRADRLPPTEGRHARTPALDDLARSSYVFTKAIANSNYSLPSHASLLTGLLPSEHGAHPSLLPSSRSRIHAPLETAVSTQAHQLREAGFVTLGLSSNYVFLARWTGLQRGFVTFDDRPRRVFRSSPLAPIVLSLLADWVGPPFRPLLPYRSAAEIRDGLQEDLERAHAPFFAFVNLMDAHEPRVPRTPRSLGSLDVARVLSYDDGVSYIDSELGQLFAWMETRGLLQTTYIVVTSDHGEFLGEHGLWGHDVGLTQTMLHVPLLIRPPGGLLARVLVEQPFGLHRILPLLTAWQHNEQTIPPDATEPELVAEAWSYPGGGSTAGLPDERAVFFGDLKLVAGRNGERQFFDLRKDPQEQHNLWSSMDPALAKRFEVVATKPPPVFRGDKARPDAEALERMRSLGYIR